MSEVEEVKSQGDDEEEPKKHINYNEIASKLLRDRFLLTALELHTELVESGRELKQLKDFFSNPGNFELTQEGPARISRSGSQATLDSLDLTRYSEDGAGTDEKVAVLEFELRKAKETINALRNNLTIATESETSTPDKGSLRNITVGGIKPHEQRALNFLINEYLLMHEYKLTSITFADENQNQDFDDWDDVGLNISRPPELLTLYREGLKQTGQTGQNLVNVSIQTENEFNSEQFQQMVNENERLNSKIATLQNDLDELSSSNKNLQKEKELLTSQLTIQDDVAKKNVANSNNNNKGSVGSESPERFEIIDKSMSIFHKRENSLEDNVSNNSFNGSDWLNVNDDSQKDVKSIANYSDIIDKIGEEEFTKEVYSLCYVNIPQKTDYETFDFILNNSINSENLIQTLSASLLKIIPNIILNKREEAIPLLVCAVHLNPKATERDKLLQQLFNLKKKPSESERIMILVGLVAIAKCSGESLVENEILPQCWLQLTHKHVERRLLVVEACTALIPYVSSPIRNSLILSMLQQMLEDKEKTVRESVIKALTLLVALCEDPNKYNQCEELALRILNDSNNNIVNISTQMLFPVLGKWALNDGCLSSSLLKNLLNKFNDYLKDTDSPNKVIQYSDKILRVINVIENLLPFLLMSVASHENVLFNIEKDMAIEIRQDLLKLCTTLTNPEKFFKSEINVGMIIYEFDKYIAEHSNESWAELDWIVDIMLPDLFNNVHHIDISQQALLQSFMNLFSHICIIFGRNFTQFKIRPLFQTHVQNLEQIISNYNQFCPSLNVLPIYLSSILTYLNDAEEIFNIFKKFLCALPLCGTPLDCLEVTVKRLCEEDFQDVVVSSLWEGVVHPRPLIRAAAANLFSHIVGSCSQSLLNTKITPALVTLASDNDVLVRTATIPALGSLITDCDVKEIHDKAYMQLQTYLADNSLKENHTLLRQLIVTLGIIANSCSATFRYDVILPQLSQLSSFMAQMSNQTRKVDMALALVEAFSNIVYSPLNKDSLSSAVLPGLRCLENVVTENQVLAPHREIVISMIKECDQKVDVSSPQSPGSIGDRSKLQNVNQGVEEMRQRVSKIFNKPTISKPNNLPNFQGIFKKK